MLAHLSLMPVNVPAGVSACLYPCEGVSKDLLSGASDACGAMMAAHHAEFGCNSPRSGLPIVLLLSPISWTISC